MAIDKKIKYEKPIVQGGVDNYLGKQPQVQAPRKWQSSPDKPATELAYITEAEKDLILKSNIHGGLEGGPNMGPSGIISLDSFGDVGGGGASLGSGEGSCGGVCGLGGETGVDGAGCGGVRHGLWAGPQPGVGSPCGHSGGGGGVGAAVEVEEPGCQACYLARRA